MSQREWDAQSDDQRLIWARQDADAATAARDEYEGNGSTSNDPHRHNRNFDERTQAGRDARWGD